MLVALQQRDSQRERERESREMARASEREIARGNCPLSLCRGARDRGREIARGHKRVEDGPCTADELILPDILVLQLRQRAVAVGEHRGRRVPAPGLAVDAEAIRLPKVGVAPCPKQPPQFKNS